MTALQLHITYSFSVIPKVQNIKELKATNTLTKQIDIFNFMIKITVSINLINAIVLQQKSYIAFFSIEVVTLFFLKQLNRFTFSPYAAAEKC